MGRVKRSKKKYVVVNDGSESRLSEKALSRRIRSEWYEGHELYRLAGEPETTLRPLHTLELYQTIHQLRPAEAAGHVQITKARDFGWHAGVFVAMGLWLNLPGFVMGLWFLGLISHFGTSLSALRDVFADGPATGFSRLAGNEPLLLPASRPVSTSEPATAEPAGEAAPEAPATSSDPLGEQLAAEWTRLDALRESLDEAAGGQLDAAKAALDELLARRGVVRAHLEGEDDDSLAQEAADLETEVTGAPDASTREVLEQALGALQARRAAVGGLRRADVRLGARARATLHQLKSIRMSLVSSDSGPDESGRTALSTLTEELRQEARSTAELDEALAGARTRPAEAAAEGVRATRKTQ